MAAESRPPAGPRHAGDLFRAFTAMAMQGFGGVLGVVQRELVDKRGWLTNEQFIEEWALAQVLPGPNVCNLALMYGHRQLGWRGAAAALAGLLALPLLTLLAVASLFRAGAEWPAVRGALWGLGAVAVGVIAGAALKLAATLRQHALGAPLSGALALLATLGLAWWHWPLVAVVGVLGAVSVGLTLRRSRGAGGQGHGR